MPLRPRRRPTAPERTPSHEIADELIERGVYPWPLPSDYEQPEAQDNEQEAAESDSDAEE